MTALSVVIPVHNNAGTLEQQLLAVLAGTDIGDEVVVVDNRSTDGSRAVAERVGRLASTRSGGLVRVVAAHGRQGEGYARNVGVAAAANDLVAFCDGDDVVGEGWVGAMRDGLARHRYVSGPVDVDRLNPPWLAGVRGRSVFRDRALLFGVVPFAHGCNLGVHRALAGQAGGFDEGVEIGVDIDFAISVWELGVEMGWLPGAVVHYRHRTSMRSLWRQGVGYGRTRPRLRRRLHGLAHRGTWLHNARNFVWLARRVPRLGDRATRARWVWVAAQLVGEGWGAVDRLRR